MLRCIAFGNIVSNRYVLWRWLGCCFFIACVVGHNVIKATCPNCGIKADLAYFVLEDKYKKAMLAAVRIPPSLEGVLIDYLGLFAPPGRAIRADKLQRVITELADLVSSAQVSRNRITHVAPIELWREGIEAVLQARDTLSLPLDNHNYLSEIVWRLAAKAAGKGEYAKPTVSHPSHRPFAEQSDDRVKELRHLRKLHAQSPNEGLAEQIANLEKQLTGAMK